MKRCIPEEEKLVVLVLKEYLSFYNFLYIKIQCTCISNNHVENEQLEKLELSISWIKFKGNDNIDSFVT